MPRLVHRVSSAAIAMVAIIVGSLTITATSAHAWPPNIPSYSTAVNRLNSLTVQAESHHASYDRDLFPHWITITGSCNTREQVLKRDGSNVTVNSSCYPTSGTWYSPFDGATWSHPADVDIDHMVPLAEAWSSGAWAWSTSQRQNYANDLGGPELWAVTDNVNQSKGDRDPGGLAATTVLVSLHLRQGMDPGEVVPRPVRRQRREVSPQQHARNLLTPHQHQGHATGPTELNPLSGFESPTPAAM